MCIFHHSPSLSHCTRYCYLNSKLPSVCCPGGLGLGIWIYSFALPETLYRPLRSEKGNEMTTEAKGFILPVQQPDPNKLIPVSSYVHHAYIFSTGFISLENRG